MIEYEKTIRKMEERHECLEMAKALYNFKATIPKTLSFRESEYLIVYQIVTKRRNWWHVINNKAEVGYVPSNYVISVQVSPDFVTKFVNECISILRKESDRTRGCLSRERQEVLLKLLERQAQIDKLIESKSQTTVATTSSPSTSSTASRISPPLLLQPQKIKNTQSTPSFRSETKVEEETSKKERKSVSSYSRSSLERRYSKDEVSEICGQVGTPLSEARKSVSSVESVENDKTVSSNQKDSDEGPEVLTEDSVYHIVEQVRRHTALSHEKSRVAVEVVAIELRRFMSDPSTLEKVLLIVRSPMAAPKLLIEETYDAKRLKVIFSELTSCKDDAQQRSWMLHEDEDIIIEYIKELTSILMNADSSITRHVISSDLYSGVASLAQYYQMEVRWNIRQNLLQALGVLCGLDRTIITLFLSSVLPMELARDMKANPRNIPKLNHSALLLIMIFSTGEAMPITHLEHLGEDFISFLINHIEDPPDTDVEDVIADTFVTLVLSYNLQFKNIYDNVVLKVISQRSVAKTFTEKILFFFNREDDPVKIFEHDPPAPHSVIKIFTDLFSSKTTANIFYTNDVKVLIDIIVRQMTDLCAGDRRRHLYLELCRLVLRNTDYSEHYHKKDEITKCFTRIFCEDTDVSLRDQQLVREISNEFPQYFK